MLTYLQDENNLRDAYDSLTDRQRTIAGLLDLTNERRGMPPHDPIDLLVKMKSWEPILRDIPAYALSFCFEKAADLHNVDIMIFQVSEVTKIWREAGESTRQKLFEQSEVKALSAGLCEWCNNFGMMRVIVFVEDGRKSYTPVKWASSEDTNTMVICDCRRQGAAE